MNPEKPAEQGIREIISKIIINKANLDHIASTGRVNGGLLVSIERAMEQYASSQYNKALDDVAEVAKKHYNEPFLSNIIQELEKLKK